MITSFLSILFLRCRSVDKRKYVRNDLLNILDLSANKLIVIANIGLLN